MEVNNSTKGAWLIHHANKLQDVRESSPFENIHTAYRGLVNVIVIYKYV